jgi:hypothetical protein
VTGLPPVTLLPTGNDQVEKWGTRLVELFHEFMCFSNIIEFFIWCVLDNDLREILANMPLKPVWGVVADL